MSDLHVLEDKILEDLFNDFLVLNKTDDLHPPLTFWPGRGGHSMDLLDQPVPIFSLPFG